MPASHVEVTITGASQLVDEIVALLTNEGFEGFWEDDNLLKCYVPEALWSPQLEERLSDLLSASAAARGIARPAWLISHLEPRNWNAEWEAGIVPIRVSDRIVIAPTWHPATLQQGDIGITIDPKMSFGTGYHETTRLMLRMMERDVHAGDQVLDIGTGTGILAIASILLGAEHAIGVDVDEWSSENAPENARLNGVEERTVFREGDLSVVPESKFTLVLANIQRNVLESILADIRSKITGEARVLFSGLLDVDREPFTASLKKAGYTIISETNEQEWIALSCTAARP